jgi:hypothetical protein
MKNYYVQWYSVKVLCNDKCRGSRGWQKVQLIDLPIPIRSSYCIGQYNRLMSSSDFCIGRLCRSFLSSDSFIDRSCFLVLSSDFCIVRLCWPVLSKKLLYRYFFCWQFEIFFSLKVGSILVILNFFTHIEIDKFSSVVQMTPKKQKLPWGPNFSAELAGKFCRFNQHNF